jgi:hypothetical protein
MALLKQLVNYGSKSTSIVDTVLALDDLITKIIFLSPKSAIPKKWMILRLRKLVGSAYETVRKLLMGLKVLIKYDVSV